MKVSAPLAVPTAVGVKLTVIVQLAPAATEAPQVLVCAKPADAEIPETESAAIPVFVKLTVCGRFDEPIS